jgi:hypothetical protein
VKLPSPELSMPGVRLWIRALPPDRRSESGCRSERVNRRAVNWVARGPGEGLRSRELVAGAGGLSASDRRD